MQTSLQHRDIGLNETGQTVLTILLLVIILAMIAFLGIGIKTGRISINNGNPLPSSTVLSPDLEKRQKELMQKEKKLLELEERLKIQQEQLNREKQRYLEKMQELLGKVEKGKENSQKAEAVGNRQENWQYLAKLYSGMKPDQVAKIFKELDSITAANILMRMGNRQASKVMGALPTDKAIEITRILKEERPK